MPSFSPKSGCWWRLSTDRTRLTIHSDLPRQELSLDPSNWHQHYHAMFNDFLGPMGPMGPRLNVWKRIKFDDLIFHWHFHRVFHQFSLCNDPHGCLKACDVGHLHRFKTPFCFFQMAINLSTNPTNYNYNGYPWLTNSTEHETRWKRLFIFPELGMSFGGTGSPNQFQSRIKPGYRWHQWHRCKVSVPGDFKRIPYG